MIINGNEFAQEIKEDLKSKLKMYRSEGMRYPKLVIFLLSEDFASQKYVEMKTKVAQEIGIEVVIERLAIEGDILRRIKLLNSDLTVDGIMVQLPVASGLNVSAILEAISPSLDVDGLTTSTLGKVFHNMESESYISATAKGILTILEKLNVILKGKNVVVVNNSVEVGLPLTACLLNRGATVEVCHKDTVDLESHTKNADVLITATGVPGLIKSDMVKKDAIVIDAGYAKDDSGKVSGDVDFESVSPITSFITPVPGGVGPMTIISLLSNVVDSYIKRING